MFALLYWSNKCPDQIWQLVCVNTSKVDFPLWLYNTNHAIFFDAIVGVVQG